MLHVIASKAADTTNDREADIELLEQPDQERPIRQPTREPVEAVDDDALDIAFANAQEELFQAGALDRGTAESLVVEALADRIPTAPSHRPDELGAQQALHLGGCEGGIAATQHRLPRVDGAADELQVVGLVVQGREDIARDEWGTSLLTMVLQT